MEQGISTQEIELIHRQMVDLLQRVKGLEIQVRELKQMLLEKIINDAAR